MAARKGQMGSPHQPANRSRENDRLVDVSIVPLAVEGSPEDERQIRERLREAYFLAGIVKEEVKAPARSRDSGLTEVLGPLQAVERYIFSHPEYTERQQALLERAQLLLQELQGELSA